MNLGALEGGLKPYGLSGLPVEGAKLRQRTSGKVTGHFLAPTVSIKMATKHAGMKGVEATYIGEGNRALFGPDSKHKDGD